MTIVGDAVNIFAYLVPVWMNMRNDTNSSLAGPQVVGQDTVWLGKQAPFLFPILLVFHLFHTILSLLICLLVILNCDVAFDSLFSVKVFILCMFM